MVDREVFKSDLDELKKWLEKRFDKQDDQITNINTKLDEEIRTNINQEVRLEIVEKKVNGYGKWLAGVGGSVAVLALKTIFDGMSGG